MEPLEIIREYREALKEMKLFTWADYLDGRAYDKASHKCWICGAKVGPRYVGSHFRQTHAKLTEHQVRVKAYSDRCRIVLSSILAKYGFKLNPNAKPYHDHIWEEARISVRGAIYNWKNGAVLEVKK